MANVSADNQGVSEGKRCLRGSIQIAAIIALAFVSGCDFLKIQEESTSPQMAPPQQTEAPPPPPPQAPPAPPPVPPEKIAELTIQEFYRLQPHEVNDRSLEKLASIYEPARLTIEKLALQQSGVTDNSFNYIKQFKNLKNLNMEFTKVSPQGLSNVSELANLEIVNLGHTPTNNQILELLATNPNIRSLDLNNTPIDDHALNVLDTFPNLERLSLAHVSGIDGGGFRGAKRLSKLKSLVLNQTGIVDQLMPIISKYPLEELHMSACMNLTDAGISKLSGMKELKYLNLRDCSTLSSRGLSKLATNQKLWAINLTNVRNFDDNGLKFLAKLKNLKHIDLAGTSVSDRGKEALRKAIPDIQFTMPY